MDSSRISSQFGPFNEIKEECSENNKRDIETDEDEESLLDQETIPDEEFQRTYCNNFREKLFSWPNNKNTRADPTKLKFEVEGPNINLKLPKRSYSSNEEKKYFFNKIKTKKKTELCKNWSLYNACYFKDNCSFAHGDRELRQSLGNNEKYKTKICKMFKENFNCTYGNRCIYLHIIKDTRLFNYKYLLEKMIEEFNIEISKSENEKKELWKILQIMKSTKQYKL